jgi:hypothetical protein
MKTLIIASLTLVGCGSAEDTWETLHTHQREVANIADSVLYGSDDTEPTPTPTVPPQSEYETEYTECETIACE